MFAFRWFRGCYVYFRIVFSSNSLYILFIFIFIYFRYFFIVLVVPYSALTDYDRSVVLTLDDRPDPQLWGHCRSTHNSSMICFFVFAVVSLWHPDDGRDVRKKPLPYNYFFTSLFYWFLCGILADNAACHREAISVQLACGDLRCPPGSWSLCDVLQYHRLCYQLWGHCKSLIFDNFLWFNDFSGHTGRKVM